MIEVPAT